MCQKSLIALREYLGYTQAEMASLLGISTRSILRIEMGYNAASINVQKQIRSLIKMHRPPGIVTEIPLRVISMHSLAKYTGNPGPQWKHWSCQRRATWWSWRRHYQRVLAEEAAGLCVIKFRYKPSLADLGLSPDDLPPAGKHLR